MGKVKCRCLLKLLYSSSAKVELEVVASKARVSQRSRQDPRTLLSTSHVTLHTARPLDRGQATDCLTFNCSHKWSLDLTLPLPIVLPTKAFRSLLISHLMAG